MKSRCNNKKDTGYSSYGARGIKVCDSWVNDSLEFIKWGLNNGYKKGLDLDRKNNNLGYFPDNCWFVSHTQNMQNTRLIQKNNKTGYRGVFKDSRGKAVKYTGKIMNNRKQVYLGTFDTKEQAAISYNNYVIENKTFHPLNKIR